MFLVRIAIAVVLALFLGGCVGQLQADVTPFHTIPDGAAGKTFFMLETKNQEGSLEWAQYSRLVAQKLESKGLRTTNPSNADFAVVLEYSIDQGRTTIANNAYYGRTSTGTTSYSTSYVGGRYVGTTTTTPDTYGVVDLISSATVYGRTVKITILDAQQSLAQKKRVIVYEATAKSEGNTGNINVVLPTIIAAMFKDWPGKSGVVQHQELPVQ